MNFTDDSPNVEHAESVTPGAIPTEQWPLSADVSTTEATSEPWVSVSSDGPK